MSPNQLLGSLMGGLVVAIAMGSFVGEQSLAWAQGLTEDQLQPHEFTTGLKTDEALFIQIIAPTAQEASAALPAKWDWREVGGQNWLTPVRSQDSCGSCTAFGFASVFESQLKIDSGWSWWNPLISVQSLFACGGGDCVTGWGMMDAIDFARGQGVIDEDCSPYVARSGVEFCRKCEDHQLRRIFLNDFNVVTSGVIDRQAIKQAVLEGPVWAHMVTYSDFRQHRFGVYRNNGQGAPLDGHTIAIVGFDDRRKSWIVKNSWGDYWGEGGYANIHYDDISGLGATAYQLNVLPKARPLVLREVEGLGSEAKELGGLRALKAHSLYGEGLSIQLWAVNESGVEQEMSSCRTEFDVNLGTGSFCHFELDWQSLDAGIYSFWAETQSPKGKRLRSWPLKLMAENFPALQAHRGRKSSPFDPSLLQPEVKDGIYLVSLPASQSLKGLRVEVLEKGKVLHYRLAEMVPQGAQLQIDLRGLGGKGPYEVRLTEWDGRSLEQKEAPAQLKMKANTNTKAREFFSLTWPISTVVE